MNQANRLAETWTPSWDLGLQDEFDFGAAAAAPEQAAEPRRAGWSRATAEVLNRQSSVDRRIGHDGSSIGDLIAYFESLYNTVEEGASHE